MKLTFVILISLFSFLTFSQEEKTRILFILDASNSMNGKWDGETKMTVAKRMLANTVDSLRDVPNLEIGLRVYGHQSPITATYQDCADTKLEVPFARNNFNFVKNKLKTIQAKGTTPIARSLEASADDFPDRTTRNIIILITDGVEACDNDPCIIADKLRAKGITISPFVIGIGLDMSYLNQFDCIGTYMEASTKESFQLVLKNVVNKALVNTTVQVNLNTIQKTPLETNVTMFFYKAGTKELKYTYTHTLNEEGLPDTLILDPELKYDLVVNTLPKVEKKNISIQKNKHNTIEVDAPQGFIKVKLSSNLKPFEFDSRVMLDGKYQTLNVQQINDMGKYIVGKYKVEVLTLPRTYATVDVKQSSTENITIDPPGTLKLKSVAPVTGQIFTVNQDGSMEWVCNLDDTSKSSVWLIQPGSYKLIYRKMHLESSMFTMEKEFRIYSNKTISLNL